MILVFWGVVWKREGVKVRRLEISRVVDRLGKKWERFGLRWW